ncbi:MAG: hydroxymethylglutaryl-CoA reductase, degradative [Myxococcales bacterium]|nr:hydroxymethylglutaryl-CoA reductase, degradative [Myxococcales bacterium]
MDNDPAVCDSTRQDTDTRPTSRLPGYFRLTISERVETLVAQGRLTEEDAELLASEFAGLPLTTADNMIENVIGVYGLPIGLGLNFVINDRDTIVPMVVEEPSIVAAVSHTARLVRDAGGFRVDADPPIMIGQVQILDCPDPEVARETLLAHRDAILDLANSLQPNMVARGGGAKEIEARVLGTNGASAVTMVVLHLLVDTCDAMGANLINTMAEGVAPLVERLTGGRVHLRILSNLADQRLVRARCDIPVALLNWKGFPGSEVARGIAEASLFAEVDPYRAATHNKGVMNGIDAVAIASGNDWRAIEAGAHAYCCRSGRYRPMSTWHLDEEEGVLRGRLEIPIQVGTVGGPIRLHPTLKVLYKVFGIDDASELARIMGAVGLAQNLAALKALATEGIQSGHMALHARTVAATAGAEGDEIERVAQQLIAEGDIKVQRARAILASRNL